MKIDNKVRIKGDFKKAIVVDIEPQGIRNQNWR